MAYATVNFQTKREFKEAVKAGKTIKLFNPSGQFPTTSNGSEYVEGPHYPQAHTWYAEVQVRGGIVVSVK